MSAPLATPRIRAPRTAKKDEIVEIRTLMEHSMETGLRTEGGRTVPRDMLTRMIVRANGEVLLQAEFRNGTSANPYHVFFLRVTETTDLEIDWLDERGRSVKANARISV
jgi:sulfur-oxidizing protein SoxZ